MEQLLALGIGVLLVMVAITITLVLFLVYRLREPRQPTPDPHLEQLSRLRTEASKRHKETQVRLGALRDTLTKGLRGP